MATINSKTGREKKGEGKRGKVTKEEWKVKEKAVVKIKRGKGS